MQKVGRDFCSKTWFTFVGENNMETTNQAYDLVSNRN
jgi:hypothetical protein